MSGWSRRWLVALAVALTLLAACSGDDDTESTDTTDSAETTESTTSTSTTTTTDPQAAVEAEVEAAYVAQWDAYVEILSEPNPENPLIDEHFTGPSREAMLDGISQMIIDGRALREPDDSANFSVRVLSVRVDGDRAELKSCVVDGLVQIDRSTSDVVNDTVVSVEFDATLRLEGDEWKLADHVVESRTDGASCDA